MSSTAKSMATSYLSAKRTGANNKYQQASRFKSSTSNLASASTTSGAPRNQRLKSTSMTNLIGASESSKPSSSSNLNLNNPSEPSNKSSTIQRPVSRNNLDSIHNGMNAKYAQVQSKVLLQNIRPQASASSTSINRQPAAGKQFRAGGRLTPNGGNASQPKVPSDRTQLLTKVKSLQEEVERLVEERENLKLDFEREKSDKNELIAQLKQELQEKLIEYDKQHEEYHQKLLEAYELADQNRRAADQVLSESRNRDESLRKKNEELESQLAELKEFVAMKEEMTGKMYELREQIREERERYEEQLKSLHQVFENEKLRQLEIEKQQRYSKASSGNYFKRAKPSLQSNESINTQSACRQCQAGESRLHQHRSEHDLYGSKLSTRMQDTAKSAWKASKQFANSVITGGVGLSACRKRGSTEAGPKSARPEPSLNQASSCHFDHQEGPKFTGEHRAPAGCAIETSNVVVDDGDDDGLSVSVIKVNSQGANLLVAANTEIQQQQPTTIRVDENNKLTIVTKFNNCHSNNNVQLDSNENNLIQEKQQTASPNAENSNPSGSERSRCESSSSGRGTSSSEAGSTVASQNGDVSPPPELVAGPVQSKQAPSQIANMHSVGPEVGAINSGCFAEKSAPKKHRRKSSLFKASKLFDGSSQTNLNKLKTFLFASNGKATINSMDGNNNSICPPLGGQESASINVDARLVAEQHLENSRLRCMELNRAIKMALPASSSLSEQVDKVDNRTLSSTTAVSPPTTAAEGEPATTTTAATTNGSPSPASSEAAFEEVELSAEEEKVGQGGQRLAEQSSQLRPQALAAGS